MSFSTPFYQEDALDLSMSTLKRERDLSAAETASYWYNNYGSQYNVSTFNRGTIYGSGYSDQAYVVPSAQAYPHTVVSTVQLSPCSNEDEAITAVPSSPKSVQRYEFQSLDDDPEYQEFEKNAMQAMAEKNGGSLLGTNPRMRRIVQTNQAANDTYRQQRERNNYAAKQSRDKRKLREVRLSLQVTYLKKKRDELRAMLAAGVCSRCRLRQL